MRVAQAAAAAAAKALKDAKVALRVGHVHAQAFTHVHTLYASMPDGLGTAALQLYGIHTGPACSNVRHIFVLQPCISTSVYTF